MIDPYNVFTFFLCVVLIFVLLRYSLYILINNFIFFPNKCTDAIPSELFSYDNNKTYKVINDYVKTNDDQKIHYAFIKNPNSQYVTLFFHGNAGCVNNWIHSITVELMLKFSSVLVFDYRGYGKSSGSPDEKGAFTDSLVCWNMLINEFNYDSKNIILVGVSLGCTFASQLGSYIADYEPTEMPKLIILQAGFYNLRSIALHLYPPSKYLFDIGLITQKFDNNAYCKNIKKNSNVPILLFHSESDEIIPCENSLKLAKSSNSVFHEIKGSHNFPKYEYYDILQLFGDYLDLSNYNTFSNEKVY
jgi:uncharacterized protein